MPSDRPTRNRPSGRTQPRRSFIDAGEYVSDTAALITELMRYGPDEYVVGYLDMARIALTQAGLALESSGRVPIPAVILLRFKIGGLGTAHTLYSLGQWMVKNGGGLKEFEDACYAGHGVMPEASTSEAGGAIEVPPPDVLRSKYALLVERIYHVAHLIKGE